MTWLMAHLSVISTGVSVATLMVWIFYAHLLYMGFRRNERPMILIHQAQGEGPGSFCLVANLSRQPLHVVTVELVLRTRGEHEIKLRMNDYKRITGDDESQWAVEDVMKEGPLGSGDFLSLGGFKSMLDATRASDDHDHEEQSRQNQKMAERAEELEIRVTALFSAFNNPVGATRRFKVNNVDGAVELDPVTPITRQMSSYQQRRRVYSWLKQSQRLRRQRR